MMKYADNQYRVVATHDRNTTIRTFATLEAAQHYTRSESGLEIQRAIEAEDGTVYEWQRTSLSQSRTMGALMTPEAAMDAMRWLSTWLALRHFRVTHVHLTMRTFATGGVQYKCDNGPWRDTLTEAVAAHRLKYLSQGATK